MLDDRDIWILEAFDRLGPDIPHVLLYHPSTDSFDNFDEVEARIEILTEAAYLRARPSTNGAEVPLTESDTIPGWQESFESDPRTHPELLVSNRESN